MSNTWGANSWGHNQWGDQDSVDILLTAPSGLTSAVGDIEAFNEEGWGRQEWGNSGWGVQYAVELSGLGATSSIGSVTTVYGCRAWIQLNQGGSQSITGSGGVSSINDEGTGTTKITFTTAMPDDNWAMVGGAQQSSDSSVNYGFSLCMQSYTTTYGILIYRPQASSDVKQDNSKIHVAFFR